MSVILSGYRTLSTITNGKIVDVPSVQEAKEKSRQSKNLDRQNLRGINSSFLGHHLRPYKSQLKNSMENKVENQWKT